MTRSRAAWVAFVLGGAAFIALAWQLVPWHPYPGGALDLPSAESLFGPHELQRMLSYSSAARWIGRSALVVSLLVSCVLGFTPLGRRLVGRLPGPWVVRVVLAVLGVTLLGWLVTLPFGAAAHRLDGRYGLSHQSWGGWIGDQLLGLGVSVVTTAIAVLALLGCMRLARRSWPLVAGLLAAVLVVLGSYVYPVVVEPLFNDFTSLPPGELRTQVLELAQREGVGVDDVLVADASRRTTTLNAYVNGFGSTRRVVLYDNLVATGDRREILTVVGHELAHAEHDDVLTGTLVGAAGALAGVGLLGLLLGALARRREADEEWYAGPAGVPLLLALFAVASILTMPVENTISRQIETRADIDGLRATRDLDAFVGLQRELAARSLADPSPQTWSQVWFGSHPTVLQRIAVGHRILGH